MNKTIANSMLVLTPWGEGELGLQWHSDTCMCYSTHFITQHLVIQ